MTPFTKNDHIRIIQLLDKKEQLRTSKESLKDEYIDANSINVDLDVPLYRIIPIDRLWGLLKEKKLGMVHPLRWDDPYELFLIRSFGLTSHGQEVGFEPIINSLYGLCFTLKPECDGLWRNFSACSCNQCSFCDWFHNHGKQPVTVKIKTTGRKLMNFFYDINNPFHTISYWIGKVEYLNVAQISKIINQGINFIMDNTGVDLINTLLVKREPFIYEQEVRLLYNMSSHTPFAQLNTPDLFFFNVEPNRLIDEIEFSPWVSEEDVNILKPQIANYYSGQISRSKLYDEPGIHIRV